MPDYEEIDIERLREYLIDFYGVAMTTGFGVATINLSQIENASDEEVIRTAIENHVDLDNYRKTRTR